MGSRDGPTRLRRIPLRPRLDAMRCAVPCPLTLTPNQACKDKWAILEAVDLGFVIIFTVECVLKVRERGRGSGGEGRV